MIIIIRGEEGKKERDGSRIDRSLEPRDIPNACT